MHHSMKPQSATLLTHSGSSRGDTTEPTLMRARYIMLALLSLHWLRSASPNICQVVNPVCLSSCPQVAARRLVLALEVSLVGGLTEVP